MQTSFVKNDRDVPAAKYTSRYMKVFTGDVKEYRMRIDKTIKIDDVIGLDDAKEVLTTRLQAFFKYRHLLKGASKGILLYGYPGTAKTMLSIAVLNTLDEDTVYSELVTADRLTEHVGTTSAKVKEFFKQLQAQAHGRNIVLVLDEADEILTVKGERSVIANERVSAMLRELDGMETENENVYIIATTNHPMKIEPAMLRSGRIDCHIKIDLPNDEQRKQMIDIYCGNIPGLDTTKDFILKYSQMWTGADYKNLGNELMIKYLTNKESNPNVILTPVEIIHIFNWISKYRKMNFAKFEKEYAALTNGDDIIEPSEARFETIYKLPKGQKL